MTTEQSLSKLSNLYVFEIEKLAANLLKRHKKAKNIMDILSDDREDFKNVGIRCTGTSSGWTGHVYEFLTTAFIKNGLSHLLDEYGWNEGPPYNKGYTLEGNLSDFKKTIRIHLNSRILLNNGEYKRPDISVMLDDEFIAIVEIKSSVSNSRSDLRTTLDRLCDYEAALKESPRCVFSLVFYGLHWTIGSLNEYTKPNSFMFVSSTKLHGGTPDKSSNFEGTRYDIGDLIQNLVNGVESGPK
ncbi:MAG: hypothetical protein ACXADD_14180 [Candidatus Thorarchaeota archaeon]|jgi:hypothetical protein